MMHWILMSIMLILNFIFMKMKHPLAMGLILLIQTIMISLMSGMTSKSFWFAYILFIVFLGGMLILFIYVTSLAANEMFTLSIKLIFMTIFMILIMIFFMIYLDKNSLMNYKNLETLMTYNNNSYILENSLSLNKLYNYPTNLLTIMLMIYLLITLIVVVKVTNLFKGPLRPMNN